MYKFVLLAAIILSGCASKNVETARAAVAASAAVYGSAVESFIIYAKLPRCIRAPAPCSDPAKVAEVGDHLVQTRAAIDRARNVVNMLPEQGDKTPVTALPLAQKALLDDAAKAAADADATVKAIKPGT